MMAVYAFDCSAREPGPGPRVVRYVYSTDTSFGPVGNAH
jgi:hypothetical protein